MRNMSFILSFYNKISGKYRMHRAVSLKRCKSRVTDEHVLYPKGRAIADDFADDLRLDQVLTGADGLDIINEFVKVFGMAACVLDAESVG